MDIRPKHLIGVVLIILGVWFLSLTSIDGQMIDQFLESIRYQGHVISYEEYYADIRDNHPNPPP